jgi:hypothetical protein
MEGPNFDNDAVVLVAAVEIEEAFLIPLFTSFLLLQLNYIK